jgi:hypothetical protein
MDPLSFLKSIWKQSESLPILDNRLTLRPGQIISGKIVKLLPNQMAEIQVGSTRLFAKLEASLNLNQQYYFQVQPGEEKIHLKLIKNNQEDHLTQTTKGSAEVINNNSSLDRSVIEQFVTQVPIQLGPDTADVTIQWNGRKKGNNKMDPNDCRILFYLELKNIGEILADLQIQNRKLSITLINGTPDLNTFVESQIVILKENLQKLNYQLTGVKIEQPVSEKPLKALIKKTVSASVETNRKTGVDIRI